MYNVCRSQANVTSYPSQNIKEYKAVDEHQQMDQTSLPLLVILYKVNQAHRLESRVTAKGGEVGIWPQATNWDKIFH